MKRRLLISLIFVFVFGLNSFAQDEDFTGFDTARKESWKQFNKQNWHKVDFTKQKINKTKIEKLTIEYPVDELALLRGVVFGKRGRVFKERSIQDYLEKQAWYKPNPKFSNSLLTKMERENLDLIRLEEAARHEFVQPGDLRYWQAREIPEEKLYSETSAGWRIMIAEIEAIHGRRFDDEPWLQKYFEERYWYKANPSYSPEMLNGFERKNLEALNAKRGDMRGAELSIGDMDKFQNVPIKEEQLKGLTLNDLRFIRNEFWARRGRKFVTPGFKQVFEWRDWYKPAKDQSKVKLNKIEEQNVKLIESIEAKMREKIATEPITAEMIEGLFIEDLRVIRNEIYARRGRVFKDAALQKYFESQAWYQPNPEFKDDALSEIEIKNLAIIRQFEDTAISKFTEFEG